MGGPLKERQDEAGHLIMPWRMVPCPPPVYLYCGPRLQASMPKNSMP